MTVESRPQLIKIHCVNDMAAIRQQTDYIVYGTGDVQVTTTYSSSATANALPSLARVGMQLQMPAPVTTLKWYGRGPFESYADRKDAAAVGLYTATVADQFFPYTMAQENGNKTDVRWAELTDATGLGLLIMSDQPVDGSLLNLNVRDYTDAALLRAKQPDTQEVVRGTGTVVNIDMAQMGLGGDDSWTPRVHPEYRLPTTKPYTYSFRLRAIDKQINVANVVGMPLPR